MAKHVSSTAASSTGQYTTNVHASAVAPWPYPGTIGGEPGQRMIVNVPIGTPTPPRYNEVLRVTNATRFIDEVVIVDERLPWHEPGVYMPVVNGFDAVEDWITESLYHRLAGSEAAAAQQAVGPSSVWTGAGSTAASNSAGWLFGAPFPGNVFGGNFGPPKKP